MVSDGRKKHTQREVIFTSTQLRYADDSSTHPGENIQDPGLQERETIRSASLSSVQYDDRSTSQIMLGVEPVPLAERLVGDGRVSGGEVSDGLGEAVSFPFGGRGGGGGEEELRAGGR